MMAIPDARAADGPDRTVSRPSTTSLPRSGRCTPARIFTSVDFPAPFSPTSPCTSPPCRWIETSSSAWIAPKAFDACSRERIGCCSVIGAGAGACREASGTPQCSLLEVELVDVRLVEDVRRPEQHGALRADLVRAELAGLERLARLARDRPRGEVHCCIGGEVAEIGRVPQLEPLDRAVLDVLAERVRPAETRPLDL